MKCPHCGQVFGPDPTHLLDADEPMATVPEIATLLGCTTTHLRELLKGPTQAGNAGGMATQVRYVTRVGAPALYCIADARKAAEPHREAMTARLAKAQVEAVLAEERRVAKAAAKTPPPKKAKVGAGAPK